MPEDEEKEPPHAKYVCVNCGVKAVEYQGEWAHQTAGFASRYLHCKQRVVNPKEIIEDAKKSK